jgi:hypothetical protein
MATMMWAWTYFEYSSGEYTRKFTDKGIKTTNLDAATLEKIQARAYEYMLADAEKNPDYAKIAFSQAKYFKEIEEWRRIQSPFTWGRTPPKIDEMYSKLEAIAKKHGVYVLAAWYQVRRKPRFRLMMYRFERNRPFHQMTLIFKETPRRLSCLLGVLRGGGQL